MPVSGSELVCITCTLHSNYFQLVTVTPEGNTQLPTSHEKTSSAPSACQWICPAHVKILNGHLTALTLNIQCERRIMNSH